VLKITLGVALLLIVALVGYRQTFTRLYLPAGARLIFLTGTEFILVGVALGDEMIGLLDEQTVRSLTPLFSLGLGAIGLIFGIQLDLSKVLRFPARYLLLAGIQAVVTMGIVFAPFYFVLEALFGGDTPSIVLAAAVLAATAACTAQTSLALIDQEFDLRGAPVMRLLRYISSLDAAVGLIALGLAFCLMHTQPAMGFGVGVGMQWFFLSLSLGTALGFLLQLLTQMRCSEEELLIFVVGMVLFSSGIALYFKLSPLFINAVMGFMVANLAGSKDRIFRLLVLLEKPFYLVFLILAGAVWHPASAWVLPIAALYLGLRFAGKLSGGFLAARAAAADARPPHGLGLGLVAQGGMAIAMVMNYYQLSAGPVTDVVVTTVLIAVVASELAGPSLAVRLLRTAGEIER
jgi:hypothetical protein